MPETTDFQLLFQQWANDILVWVGFGTLVGLLAKAIMPGRDPGGAVANLGMGVGGTVIGCGLVSFFMDGRRVTPISAVGFAVAIGGSAIILFFYRLLSGRFNVDGERRTVRVRTPHHRRRRQMEVVQLDD